MRVVANDEILATDVDVATSTLERARGLMFRRTIPGDYALVFPFEDVRRRWIHMLFVPFPITVVWLVADRIERVERLAAWIGVAHARAETVIELPAAAADELETGDVVRVVPSSSAVGGDH